MAETTVSAKAGENIARALNKAGHPAGGHDAKDDVANHALIRGHPGYLSRPLRSGSADSYWPIHHAAMRRTMAGSRHHHTH